MKSRPKLFIGGKVLHIVRKKKSEVDKKSANPTCYEMRWCQAEDFLELKGIIKLFFNIETKIK
jgi:sn1-specific diacylglycerol lipase